MLWVRVGGSGAGVDRVAGMKVVRSGLGRDWQMWMLMTSAAI